MTKTPDKAAARPPEQLRADARQNHARLLAAASEAFAEHGADAPLEDIARRAGVGIGTLYRHFPTRLDLQAAAFRNQVTVLCGQAEEHLDERPRGHAFFDWIKALAAYMTSKRGLSKALMEALGKDAEVISTCWVAMRDTTERTLTEAQQAGLIRTDVDPIDVMRLVHGVVSGSERAPEQTPRLLSIMLDGLRPQAGSLSLRAKASLRSAGLGPRRELPPLCAFQNKSSLRRVVAGADFVLIWPLCDGSCGGRRGRKGLRGG
ncbi:MAG: TetR/AcrR family transcriptional regulator [Streptosporangiaceae bacterium]|nr:TetR/AcrR family transcriptional regulator [Streptosporangiaceae bacterium]